MFSVNILIDTSHCYMCKLNLSQLWIRWNTMQRECGDIGRHLRGWFFKFKIIISPSLCVCLSSFFTLFFTVNVCPDGVCTVLSNGLLSDHPPYTSMFHSIAGMCKQTHTNEYSSKVFLPFFLTVTEFHVF